MTDFINLNAMEEAITDYKQMQREETEQELIEALKKAVEIYKKYNPKGSYLSLSYVDGAFSVTNAFYDEDRERPVHACDDEQGFCSFPLIDYEEEDEEDDT